jgi:hypothetical protein
MGVVYQIMSLWCTVCVVTGGGGAYLILVCYENVYTIKWPKRCNLVRLNDLIDCGKYGCWRWDKHSYFFSELISGGWIFSSTALLRVWVRVRVQRVRCLLTSFKSLQTVDCLSSFCTSCWFAHLLYFSSSLSNCNNYKPLQLYIYASFRYRCFIIMCEYLLIS